MKNSIIRLVRAIMPCCILGLLLHKQAHAIIIISDPAYTTSDYEKSLLANDFTQFDEFSFQDIQRPSEFQTPVFIRRHKDSDNLKLALISTQSRKTRTEGMRVRGLTFYFVPDQQTQWKLKIRKSKIHLSFQYDFQ